MVFIDKLTPSDYQDKNEYNNHVLTERYNTARSLRESYSNIYQEITFLRNCLQDFKGEQDNQPEFKTAESDRIRFNNLIEDKYLAIKSIQENTIYPSDYGHTVRPFIENNAAEQIRLSCQYIISGFRHMKQYYLGRTSCMTIDEEMRNGEEIYDFDSTKKLISNNAISIGIGDITISNQAVVTTSGNHNFKRGDKIFIGGISEDSMININNQRFQVGEIVTDTKFYIEDNNGDKVNSSNYKPFDPACGGYILPDPTSEFTGFNMIKSISKDRSKALISTTKNHNLKDGDFVKIRGVADQHNELIQSTSVEVINQVKITKDEVSTFEIDTSDEYALQDSFKVGDNIWLSDSNTNLDRTFLNNVGKIEFISTPNSIIFEQPILHTAAINNYVFYSNLDSKDSVAQISRDTKCKSNQFYVNYASLIPKNSYIVAKSGTSNNPKIIGVVKYSYLYCTKTFFHSNLKPGETNYVTTTKDISSRLIEGSVLYSSDDEYSWAARVVSVNGDTRRKGNLKVENLSNTNLFDLPIYLAKVKLIKPSMDDLNQRDQIFVLESPNCPMRIKNSINSQQTYITVTDNPRLIKNGYHVFSVNPKSDYYDGIIFYHGKKSNHSSFYKLKVLGNQDITIPDCTTLYKGDNLGTVLNDNIYQVVYNDNKSFYILDDNKKYVSTEFLSSAYNFNEKTGNGILENILKFKYKKFYLNKLDAADEKLTYGNSYKTISYDDTYVKDLQTKEGHIYLLPTINKKVCLDGRQTASILGRNIVNCENILSILANNINTCDRALNRIVDIARMLKINLEIE